MLATLHHSFLKGLFMLKIFTLVIGSILSVPCFAGVSPDMLANTLKIAEVQAALGDQEINSIKVVYERPGRARFDFDIVICGVSSEIENEAPVTVFHKTKIYGRLAFFGRYSDGDITKASGRVQDPECKNKK